MKKMLSLSLLILIMAALVVTPALAGGTGGGGKVGHQRNGDRFALVGWVTEVSEVVDGTITVNVWMGNQLVKEYIDDVLTIKTDENTRFRCFNCFNDPECEPLTFADVGVGDAISAGGVVNEDDGGIQHFLAGRVTMDVPLDTLP